MVIPLKFVTPIVAVAVFDGSATLAAVIVTTPGVAGAINVAEVLFIVGKLPPVADHVTPTFPVSLVSVALIARVCEVTSPPRFGETLTVIFVDTAVTVMVAAPLLVPSVADVAVSVTVAGFGAVAGALYVTEVVVTLLSVPHAVPLHPLPVSNQLTPLFCASFWTVTVKFRAALVSTLAVAGETVTTIADAAVTVIVDVFDFVPSRLDVAVSVTMAGLGSVAGAV